MSSIFFIYHWYKITHKKVCYQDQIFWNIYTIKCRPHATPDAFTYAALMQAHNVAPGPGVFLYSREWDSSVPNLLWKIVRDDYFWIIKVFSQIWHRRKKLTEISPTFLLISTKFSLVLYLIFSVFWERSIFQYDIIQNQIIFGAARHKKKWPNFVSFLAKSDQIFQPSIRSGKKQRSFWARQNSDKSNSLSERFRWQMYYGCVWSVSMTKQMICAPVSGRIWEFFGPKSYK